MEGQGWNVMTANRRMCKWRRAREASKKLGECDLMRQNDLAF